MKYRLKKSKTRRNKIFGVGVIVLGIVTVGCYCFIMEFDSGWVLINRKKKPYRITSSRRKRML